MFTAYKAAVRRAVPHDAAFWARCHVVAIDVTACQSMRDAWLPLPLSIPPHLRPPCSFWETTGFFNFQLDFPHGGTHLLLNHSYVPPSDLQPGFVEPRSFRVRKRSRARSWPGSATAIAAARKPSQPISHRAFPSRPRPQLNLNISDVQMPLAGYSSDLPPYTAVMWFNVSRSFRHAPLLCVPLLPSPRHVSKGCSQRPSSAEFPHLREAFFCPFRASPIRFCYQPLK